MSKEMKNISRFELLMDAGFGAQKSGDILIQAFARTGKYVYIEPMIPAEISPPPRTRPALSGVIIRVADFDITNIGNDTDLILASHEIVLDRRLDDEETNPNARVLLDMGNKPDNEESYAKVIKRVAELKLNLFPFEIDAEAKKIIHNLGGKGENMYYMGMLAAIYNMPPEPVIIEIKEAFGKKLKEEVLKQNLLLFDHGYQFAQKNVNFSFEIKGTRPLDDMVLIDGNSSLSMGIIDAGIKFYSGYPITPASSIMHTLAKQFPSYGGVVHQAEDEIAAIGSAIGASYGGVTAVTATSGPGLSLKQEFIGFATAAEVPLIVIDVQRSGPSTGMPTKTEQSDLLAAIFGSHGDYAKIVLSVSNIIDCFYAPQVARYLAEKLKLPVFILSDFLTANSYKVIQTPKITLMDNINDIPDFVLERFHIQRLPEKIEMVRNRQDIPGTPGGMRRITGLNTTAEGSINYFAGTNHRSHAVRNEKVHVVQRALTKPEMFGPEENEVLIVGWGSARGTIEEAIVNKCMKLGIPASGLHLKIVYPLPLMLKDIFSKFKKVVTVEVAYGDELKPSPLAFLLRAHTCMDIRPLISKASGRPLRPNGIVNKVAEMLGRTPPFP
ncbi:MAG: 2-oxoacid:acceptor oxidoreductase family protein [Candidatus Omnitrophota bacterium]|nr:2-oxoacid:acceptor oxidoreductase family protein [Candidatus Omnitrophota bacterium]MDZ4241983.1 2-oxoacid:acceptor oxidoreductase family protein [Candidatus Omnitrophota bacterium]